MHTFYGALGPRVEFVQSEFRESLLLPFDNKCRLYFRTGNFSLAITKRNILSILEHLQHVRTRTRYTRTRT